ncbi:MAG TPA: hypothetical protein VIY86_06335, partial [Pirellulaceae bacterium]
IWPSGSSAQWIDQLPNGFRRDILWRADHEEGTLADWTYPSFRFPGGGIFNTGGADVSAWAFPGLAHSGNFSARADIQNAIRAQNGPRAVRLMRWTDRPWDDQGNYFPKLAYYSTWMYMPRVYNPNKYPPWDPGDGGWWNVFQFKADDLSGLSQPMWSLNVGHDDSNGKMFFYLYSPVEPPHGFGQQRRFIPVAQWFHVEALYVVSATGHGRIAIWQDGQKILDVRRAQTALFRANQGEHAVWGLGNYTNHINSSAGIGRATIYFDDAMVSRRRVSSIQASGIGR